MMLPTSSTGAHTTRPQESQDPVRVEATHKDGTQRRASSAGVLSHVGDWFRKQQLTPVPNCRKQSAPPKSNSATPWAEKRNCRTGRDMVTQAQLVKCRPNKGFPNVRSRNMAVRLHPKQLHRFGFTASLPQFQAPHYKHLQISSQP